MAGIADYPGQPELTAASRGHGPSFAINPRHVRTLLWLRWKLTMRGYTRNWRRIVSLVFTLLFLLWFAGAAGAGSAAAYLLLPRDAAVQVLFAALTLLYIVWAVLPLLQYNLNEGLDVTKLQIYPLTRGEQMVSLVLATLLDVSVLFIAALYIAVLVGWHATPLAVVLTVVALALAYIHTVGFSQLVLAALMGLLRSRRYRDTAIIFFALLASGWSIGNQLLFRQFFREFSLTNPDALATLHLDRYLQWTPPGMAAKAIVLANAGQYAEALPWLLAAAALVPVLLALWSRTLERGITSAESGGMTTRERGARRGRAAAADTAGSVGGAGAGAVAVAGHRAGAAAVNAHVSPARDAIPARRRWRVLSGPALAIARKDLTYIQRDPQLKAALLSALLATAFIFIPNLYGGNPDSPSSSFIGGGYSVFLAPLPALLVVLALSLNALGLERQGLQTLFLFPVRALDVFWGKNLVAGSIAYALAVLLTLVKAALTGGWANVPLALAAGLAAVFVMLGCGNVTSVLAPFRARQMRMGDAGSMSSENGCLRSILSMVSLGVTFTLLLPVAGAIAVPLLFGQSAWLAVSLPAAILYGLVLYQAATRIIAPVMTRRAPEILAVTVREA